MVPYREPIVALVSRCVGGGSSGAKVWRAGAGAGAGGMGQAEMSGQTSEVCGEVYSVGSLLRSVDADAVERARASRMSQGHEPNNEAQWTPRRSQDEWNCGSCGSSVLCVVFQSIQRSSSRYRQRAILRILTSRLRQSLITTIDNNNNEGSSFTFHNSLEISIIAAIGESCHAWLASVCAIACMPALGTAGRRGRSRSTTFPQRAPPDHLLFLSLHN